MGRRARPRGGGRLGEAFGDAFAQPADRGVGVRARGCQYWWIAKPGSSTGIDADCTGRDSGAARASLAGARRLDRQVFGPQERGAGEAAVRTAVGRDGFRRATMVK